MVETFNCETISLKKGSKGAQVTLLQTHLKTLGYYVTYNNRTLKVDGDFGTYTEWAVKKFQKDTGHTQDGWFGPKTCKSLNEKINKENGVSTTTNSSTTSSSSSSSASSTANYNLPRVDTSKNVFSTAESNLSIEGINLIMSDITFNQAYKSPAWKSIAMMQGNYNYLTDIQPLKYTVVCYLSNKQYKQLESEFVKMGQLVCNVVSEEIRTGKYKVSVEVANQKKTYKKVTFTLEEYA